MRGTLPLAVWLITFSTLLERFAYYSFLGPLRKALNAPITSSVTLFRLFALENYVQNTIHDPLRPGALGLGQSTSSLLNNAFLVLSYTTPMFAAVVSDEHLGRFRTIVWSMRYTIERLSHHLTRITNANGAVAYI